MPPLTLPAPLFWLPGDEEDEETPSEPFRTGLKPSLTFLSADELWRYILFRSLGSAEGEKARFISNSDVFCAAHVRNSRSMRKRKQATPIPAMMMPGTMKDKPQLEETQYPAIREPRMFPTDVCEFHRPMMRPRLTGSDITASKRLTTVRTTLASAEINQRPEASPLPSFPKPVADAGDDTGPAGGLDQTVHHLEGGSGAEIRTPAFCF